MKDKVTLLCLKDTQGYGVSAHIVLDLLTH